MVWAFPSTPCEALPIGSLAWANVSICLPPLCNHISLSYFGAPCSWCLKLYMKTYITIEKSCTCLQQMRTTIDTCCIKQTCVNLTLNGDLCNKKYNCNFKNSLYYYGP